jgi:hypothetical protein
LKARLQARRFVQGEYMYGSIVMQVLAANYFVE